MDGRNSHNSIQYYITHHLNLSIEPHSSLCDVKSGKIFILLNTLHILLNRSSYNKISLKKIENMRVSTILQK